jgi:Uma2 family endonuclease
VIQLALDECIGTVCIDERAGRRIAAAVGPRVTTTVSTLLSSALRDRPCAVYSPDLRVRLQATGLGTCADVTVICGELQFDPEDPKRHTALNPWVIVEVLGPSTEEYDRGAKLEHYCTIPSLAR